MQAGREGNALVVFLKYQKLHGCLNMIVALGQVGRNSHEANGMKKAGSVTSSKEEVASGDGDDPA